MSPFDHPAFWNPKMRGPLCSNPPAARSILPLTYKRTELVLAGLSKAQIIEGIKIFDKKELPALEPGAMSCMMSSQGYLNDSVGHWVPHLMFYIPLTDGMTWGADVPGSPVLLNPQFNGAPEPVTEFMIPVPEWSDGAPAPTGGQQRDEGLTGFFPDVIDRANVGMVRADGLCFAPETGQRMRVSGHILGRNFRATKRCRRGAPRELKSGP